MKTILTLLTGIVFLITILAAGGCAGCKDQKDSEQVKTLNESPRVDISLKAVAIDGSMHLLMYDSKNEGCVAIDGLLTVVNPGDTVIWKKAPKSDITRIVGIIPKSDSRNIFGSLYQETGPDSLWTLNIPTPAEPDTVAYGIKFSVVGYGDSIFIIDPYLRIP